MILKVRMLSCALVIIFLIAAGCTKFIPDDNQDETINEDLEIITLNDISMEIPYEDLGMGKIVFQRSGTGSQETNGFYIIDVDDKSTQGFQLKGLDYNPCISPNGEFIAFNQIIPRGSASGSEESLENLRFSYA